MLFFKFSFGGKYFFTYGFDSFSSRKPGSKTKVGWFIQVNVSGERGGGGAVNGAVRMCGPNSPHFSALKESE